MKALQIKRYRAKLACNAKKNEDAKQKDRERKRKEYRKKNKEIGKNKNKLESRKTECVETKASRESKSCKKSNKE